ELYQQKDLEGLLLLWSEKSPFLAQNKLSLERDFTTNEKIDLKGFEIRKMRIEGEEATLRVAAILAAIRAKSEDTVEKIEKKNRTIQLKNEGGIWKVWKFTSSEEEMAEALVKADSKAGRARLLAQAKE